jgi:hypothetical protein
VDIDDNDVLAFRRSSGDVSLLVLLNFGDHEASVTESEIGRRIEGIVEVSSSMNGIGRALSSRVIRLEPRSGLVIREH